MKRKSQRINTGMKLIGVKSIDDLFKIAALPLADSIQMRSKLEATMVIAEMNFSSNLNYKNF